MQGWNHNWDAEFFGWQRIVDSLLSSAAVDELCLELGIPLRARQPDRTITKGPHAGTNGYNK